MNFFKGLFSVAIIYAVAWSIYQIGFMNGHNDAMNDQGYVFDKTAKAFE